MGGEFMTEPILTVEHLTKKYNSHTVLYDINLQVHEGEVVVIVGPSGSGKSTLLRCINALEEIGNGGIRLHGRPVTADAKDLPKIRQKIGMVFQSYELFPHLTVINNILLAPMKAQRRSREEVHAEAMTLLTRVGLADKADSYPRQLSGGQKQRVAIVRALCMHPEILLFDEVTAALDPEMVREVLEVILQLAEQKKTMLIVTHEMQFARAVADRIILLDDGRIQDDTTPEEFFDAPKTDLGKRFLQSFEYTRAPKTEVPAVNRRWA